jgi:hypothetical protein
MPMAGSVLVPRRSLHSRLADPARLRTGVAWLALIALADAAVFALLVAGGDRPGDLPPWLNIPASEYF